MLLFHDVTCMHSSMTDLDQSSTLQLASTEIHYSSLNYDYSKYS